MSYIGKLKTLLFLLLFDDIGNLTAGAVVLDVDPHAADF
jgi:hypothetical protein